jgi:hypothetical protein
LARAAVASGAAVEPQLREAPVDLHARSAVAGVLDARSGELRMERVPAASDSLVAWLAGLPAPVRVAYEAGPTGFELARARLGIACLVAAPAKIPRAPADRVKTDRLWGTKISVLPANREFLGAHRILAPRRNPGPVGSPRGTGASRLPDLQVPPRVILTGPRGCHLPPKAASTIAQV